jgi:hypothetical protein
MLDIRFMLTLLESTTVYPDAVVEDRSTRWLPITADARYLPMLIEDWLHEDRLTCCSFQGGFWITIDGSEWNERTTDEFWMTMNWLQGLTQMLKGATHARVHFWEESALSLERHGDTLTMAEHERHRQHVPNFCPPVKVSFTEFVQQIARESLLFAAWVRALHSEIARRLPLDDAMNAIKDVEARHTVPATDAEKLGKILWEIPPTFITDIEQFAAHVQAHTGK